jgi:spore germination protein
MLVYVPGICCMGECAVYIHVVQAGETVWGISVQYGVTIQSIGQANLLPSFGIVPGQTLLVPVANRSYVVMPGDTLRRIASRYRVSLNELITLNPGIQTFTISPGQIIQFPTVSRPEKTILGFLELIRPEIDVANVQSYGSENTYFALFTYGMSIDKSASGAIIPAKDEAVLQSLVQKRTMPTATFSNWTGSKFSRDVVRTILSSPTKRQQYISELLKIIAEKGYKAVVIDFESLLSHDGKLFVAFLKELSAGLQPIGIPSIVCVMPIVGKYKFEKPMIQAYDYAELAKYTNYIMLMSYNWSWPGGPPGAIAPLVRVEENIRYALSQVPGKQLLLGIIRYGYDWVLPFQKGELAETMEIQAIVEMAMQNGISIQFDNQSLTPLLRYWDSSGRQHVIWFEDARSLQLKLQLVQKYKLAGIAAWELSQRFPQFTQLVNDNFRIR